MRTLLAESFPPQTAVNEASASAGAVQRTFSESPVLASLANLLGVGVEGNVIATPGALHAEYAFNALEHGMANSNPNTGASGGDPRRTVSHMIRPALESLKESFLPHEPS